MTPIDDRLELTSSADGATASTDRPPTSTPLGQTVPAEQTGTTVAPMTNGNTAGRTDRTRRLALPFLLAVVVLGGWLGFRYWQDQQLYVSTDNALVTGSLVQVGSLNAGRVESVGVDVGQSVTRDQVVATVRLPSTVATTAGGTPKLGFRGTDDEAAPVRSPMDGVVVARSANPGDTTAVGQPLLTVVDPTRLWVQAQIDETKIGSVHPGQTVEVTFDTLGQVLPGRVVAVGRATAATFSLLPQSNTSSNFTKVTQVVPVKISVDYGQASLVLGSSVAVRIRVG